MVILPHLVIMQTTESEGLMMACIHFETEVPAKAYHLE
jgi:hypothetical protein